MFNNSAIQNAVNSVGAMSTWSGLVVAAMLLLLLPISQVSQVAAAPPSSKAMQNIFAECQAKNNITEQELEDFPADPQPEDVEQKFKCYAHCLLDSMDLFDSDGKLNEERFQKYGEVSDRAMAAVRKCKADNDMVEDQCEYGFAMLTCTHV